MNYQENIMNNTMNEITEKLKQLRTAGVLDMCRVRIGQAEFKPGDLYVGANASRPKSVQQLGLKPGNHAATVLVGDKAVLTCDLKVNGAPVGRAARTPLAGVFGRMTIYSGDSELLTADLRERPDRDYYFREYAIEFESDLPEDGVHAVIVADGEERQVRMSHYTASESHGFRGRIEIERFSAIVTLVSRSDDKFWSCYVNHAIRILGKNANGKDRFKTFRIWKSEMTGVVYLVPSELLEENTDSAFRQLIMKENPDVEGDELQDGIREIRLLPSVAEFLEWDGSGDVDRLRERFSG